ncbi:hypothetical protein GA0116948_101575 [Chitinophaga costaii]|uniref:Uncharacterized protein n=1 Tax=Chitinophaga costaii TaxID=1335309 RepID=A0A1C3ZVU3_9BACT|nr:hypothetical protein [Chitinophaga costaii]PUZ30526.1 hypothetical protein DCM91_03415 [Chitinophaga costaii]SCB86499.1 hypothetical protein GA0116948_101575 [Chitinophaga costaii]
MTYAEFLHSLAEPAPAAFLPPLLQSLWWDRKGNWAQAHTLADIPGAPAAWVHAYLHRKEGDPGNAAYWYRKAGKPVSGASLQAEWEQITLSLLDTPPDGSY